MVCATLLPVCLLIYTLLKFTIIILNEHHLRHALLAAVSQRNCCTEFVE